MTQEELRRLLSYDPETGVLTWLVPVRYGLCGKPAGHVVYMKKGGEYVMVCIARKQYLAHRLIWFYMTGSWPKEQIDHVDGDGLKNAWRNLREASNSQNKANSRKYRSGREQLKGVSSSKDSPGFRAQIQVDGKKKYLGTFRTAEDAHAAYVVAAKELFGEFARTS